MLDVIFVPSMFFYCNTMYKAKDMNKNQYSKPIPADEYRELLKKYQ